MKVFNKENIFLNLNASDKNDALLQISKLAANLKIVSNFETLYNEFLKREKEVSTGFEDGFCIPHARSDKINTPAVLYISFKNSLEWNSLDNKKTKYAFVIMVPKSVSKKHVRLLAKISKALLDLNFRNRLKKAKNKLDAFQIIDPIFKAQKTDLNEGSKKELKFVAVCSCPAGIAHTYMAKEKLLECAVKNNYHINIETQGAVVEDVLTTEQIKATDYVILAVDISIDESRFVNKKVYRVPTIQAIKDPEKVFKNTIENSTLLHSEKNENENSQTQDNTVVKLNKDQKKQLKNQIKFLKKEYLKVKKENWKQIFKLKIAKNKQLKQYSNQNANLANEAKKFQAVLLNDLKNNKKIVFTKIKNLQLKKQQKLKVLKTKKQQLSKPVYNQELNKVETTFLNEIKVFNEQLKTLNNDYVHKLKQNDYLNSIQKIKLKNDQKIIKKQQKVKDTFVKYFDVKNQLEQTKNRVFYKSIFSAIGYLIPIIIVAGIFIALGSLGTKIIVNESDGSQQWITPPFADSMKEIGSIILNLVPGFLAMYIAFAIGNKPALAPAFAGGVMISNSKIMSKLLLFDINHVIEGVKVDPSIANGGFLGGILIGFIAGYIAKAINHIRISAKLRPIVNLLFSPLLNFLILFVLNAYVIGTPITFLTALIYVGLFKLTEYNNPGINVLIAVIFASMINVDFGGPINKTAFFLSGTIAITSLQANKGDIFATNYLAQNAVQAAISIGPLGVWLSVWLFPYKFNQQEKIAGNSALVMGLFGISEGALPFVFARPKKVILSSILGSIVVGIIIGLLSTYNNLKFVAGLGSPIGAWIGFALNSGYGFYWFLTVMLGALVMAVSFGLSIETNEIVLEEYKLNKILKLEKYQALGLYTKPQIFKYKLNVWKTNFKTKLMSLKKLDTWIIRNKEA